MIFFNFQVGTKLSQNLELWCHPYQQKWMIFKWNCPNCNGLSMTKETGKMVF